MNVRTLKSYCRVWYRLTVQQFETQIANSRGAALLLILGKLFRLGSAFLLIYIIVGRARELAGYNLSQAIFILALFNLVSSITQLFMRGIYLFRQKIVDGTFDFYLLNPLSELFYSLFSYTDPMDLTLLFPYIGITVWAWAGTGYPLTVLSIVLVFFAVIIAFIFAVSWHIIILGTGIRYLEVDNTIMLYRDLEKMASYPTNMYGKLGSSVLTYFFPFALMATIPANLVFSLMSPWMLLFFAGLALLALKFALWFWHRSLRDYSSASS